jgi:hypothetical protein
MQRHHRAAHVSKNVTVGSSPESIVTIWTHRLELRHPVSIPDGFKRVYLQMQSDGLSCAKVLIPESLMFLGAANGGFAARLIDKIFESLVESGKQRNSTVTLVG